MLVLPGRDADDVGAELGEFGQHKTVDAFADRGQQDHRRNADRDAERGQEGAQAVRGERVQGEAQGVGEVIQNLFVREDAKREETKEFVELPVCLYAGFMTPIFAFLAFLRVLRG